QNVGLAVEQADVDYLGTKALLAAQQTTLREAQTNLEAAEQRHRVGLATIADELQARTALSQARLSLQAIEGQLQTTRGALALSMGLPANVPYDIALPSDTTVPLGISDSVDPLIERAVRERPDLAAERAEGAAAQRARGFEQQVIYEVFNAYYALRTATQQVRTSGDLLASATQSEQVALGRYKAGAGSLLDLLTAQAALASARAQAIGARFSWYIALAQLAHDAGILGLDGASPLHIQADTTGLNK